LKNNNLSKSKVLELANMFTSQVFSIYEFEKVSGIPSNVILKVFSDDLYEINESKAEQVNKILNVPGYLGFTGYIKEYARY